MRKARWIAMMAAFAGAITMMLRRFRHREGTAMDDGTIHAA